MNHRLKKLLLVRLFFAAALLFFSQTDPQGAMLAFCTAATTICFLSLAYVVWYLTKRRLRWLAFTQIFGDVLIIAYLVAYTGGVESLFAVTLPLTILSTALVLGDRMLVILMTLFACTAYLIASALSSYWGFPVLMPRDNVYFFYGTGVRISIFVAIGYLSRRLSETVADLKTRLNLSERLCLLGEVASKIAHEVRNPLSSIRTASEVLEEHLKGALSEQDARMVSIIHGESDRLSQTLQRILNYAKQAKPDPQMLDLDPIVNRVLSVAELRQESQSGIRAEKHYDLHKTKFFADEEQLISALLNLVLNAYQAMPQGGDLIISAEEKIQGTHIRIKDSGQGIPREKQAELFTPFKSTRKGGTGLGLAEVHKVLTLHEGQIRIESNRNTGTTFHLFFPKP